MAVFADPDTRAGDDASLGDVSSLGRLVGPLLGNPRVAEISVAAAARVVRCY